MPGLLGFHRADLQQIGVFLKIMIRDRFLGSLLGIAWSIVTPLLMLGIFTFVFGFVFKSKLPGAETSLAYVIWLISGYGPWLAISEGIMASTVSVTGNAQLVKNLTFKTELLPLAGSLTGIVPLLVATAYLVVLLAAEGRWPQPAWAMLVPIILCQFALVAGIGLLLAALNVLVRDIAFVMPNVLLVVMFASPIFYPIDAYPAILREAMQFNPFYVIAESYRRPLLLGEVAPSWMLPYLATVAGLVFLAGLKTFRLLRRHFDSLL